ncbi:hypothetical protein [Thioalkalivibrio sp. ALE23]|uniref:hypothetical protein n=1 Tax=Thioalkalivibrio sp. ALE23 TaxID=1265495 RepID=UPI0003744B90|nr:hypothetical protein [Thioalkalivibrio sp. ALE23]
MLSNPQDASSDTIHTESAPTPGDLQKPGVEFVPSWVEDVLLTELPEMPRAFGTHPISAQGRGRKLAQMLGKDADRLIRRLRESVGNNELRRILNRVSGSPFPRSFNPTKHTDATLSSVYGVKVGRDELRRLYAETPEGETPPPILEYRWIRKWVQARPSDRVSGAAPEPRAFDHRLRIPSFDHLLPIYNTALFARHLSTRAEDPQPALVTSTPDLRTLHQAQTIPSDLTHWDSLTEAEREQLALAVYAVGSILHSGTFLMTAIRAVPELLEHWYGEEQGASLRDRILPMAKAMDVPVPVPMFHLQIQRLVAEPMADADTLRTYLHDALLNVERIAIHQQEEAIEWMEYITQEPPAPGWETLHQQLSEITDRVSIQSVQGLHESWRMRVSRLDANRHDRETIESHRSALMEFHGQVSQFLSELDSMHEEIAEAEAFDGPWKQRMQRMEEVDASINAFVERWSDFLADPGVLPPNPLHDGRVDAATASEGKALPGGEAANGADAASGSQSNGQGGANEQDLTLVMQELEEARQRVARLESENLSLRSRLDNQGQETTDPGTLQSAFEHWVEHGRAIQALEFLQALYPDRLRVLDGGLESARERAEGLEGRTLINKLHPLITRGLDLMRTPGVRHHDVIQSLPGDLAFNESETVRNHEKYRKHRRFSDGEQVREMFAHLSVDYSHRLYFEYDTDEDRILVGYVGTHLPGAKAPKV